MSSYILSVSAMMTQLTSVRRQFTVFGVCAIILNVIFLSVFYLSLHLGWTLLSNNVFVVLVGCLHRCAAFRIQRATELCNEDTHQIILFEVRFVNRCRVNLFFNVDKFKIDTVGRNVLQTNLLSFETALENDVIS